MSVQKIAVLGASAVMLSFIVLTTGWGSAAASAVQSVLVTNTSTNPVPVKAVGTVAVQEQGTPNVNVANSPLPVTVINKSLRMDIPPASEEQVGQLDAAPGANQVQNFGHTLYAAYVDFNTDKTPATVTLLNGSTAIFTEDMPPASNYFHPLTMLLPVTGVQLDCAADAQTHCKVRFNLAGVAS